MAKGSGKKGSKKGPRTVVGAPERAARLEKALAAGLKREAKAASRLQAARLEVAVLRMALAEVVGGEPAVPAPPAAADMTHAPQPKRAAARPRPVKAPEAAKPAPVAKAPAARTRRTTRPAPADR